MGCSRPTRLAPPPATACNAPEDSLRLHGAQPAVLQRVWRREATPSQSSTLSHGLPAARSPPPRAISSAATELTPRASTRQRSLLSEHAPSAHTSVATQTRSLPPPYRILLSYLFGLWRSCRTPLRSAQALQDRTRAGRSTCAFPCDSPAACTACFTFSVDARP